MAQLIVNGFTVGTELQSVVLSLVGGQSIPVETIGHLKELAARQEVTPLTQSPVIYNGKRLHRNIYHDWSGDLVFGRFGGDLVNLLNGIQENFHATGAETYCTIFATVANTTIGSVDEYLFRQCVLTMSDFGRYGGLAEVDQSIAFRSQSLVITGTSNNVRVNGPTVGTAP